MHFEILNFWRVQQQGKSAHDSRPRNLRAYDDQMTGRLKLVDVHGI